MNIQVTKVKNMKGRVLGYRASNDVFGITGDTPANAKQNLDIATTRALTRLASGMRVNRWNGHVIVVAANINDWEYWIDTFSQGYSCSGYETKEKAEDAAFHHLAQNLWSLSVSDDAAFLNGLPECVKKEMASWMRWQRSYAALKAQGMSDNEAHAKASGYAIEEKG